MRVLSLLYSHRYLGVMCPIIAERYSISPCGVFVNHCAGGRTGRYRESFANKRRNSFLHRKKTQ